MSFTIGDLQPRVDVGQASRHLELLHTGGEGYTSLVLLGQGRREQHSFVSTDELWSKADDPEQSATELQEIVDQRWNVYTACAVLKDRPERGRGSRADVASIPGVWADLDVKAEVDGFFQSAAEIDDYIDKLIKPTLVVASGSGGRHVYWLVHPEQRPNAASGEQLLARWRDYLLEAANGLAIDYVHDTTRILRLAGTVRWPKEGENLQPMPVTICTDNGPRYHLDELKITSESAHLAAEEVRREQRARQAHWMTVHRDEMSKRGLELAVYDRCILVFNNDQDWGELLERTGWTLCSDQRGQVGACRYWTRPGKSSADGKSAATDWVDQDGVPRKVMTIYSRDPSLEDIFETTSERGQVMCTKWHYALTRIFSGDEVALLQSIAQGGGVLP